MKRAFLLLLAGFLLSAIGLIVYLHGVSIPLWQPAGPVALAEKHIIVITLLLCSIVVVPVFVLLFYFSWKYRADNPVADEHHEPDWDHDSRAAEIIWWLVPSIIIVILAVLAWQSSNALDPYKPLSSDKEAITVQVVALDWKWLFIYPKEGIASVNMLEFPENTPIHFELTADAPMNSFWIPSLGGQIMVMPGMTTQLNLLASREGIFNGVSGNISGEGFSGMTFAVKAVSDSDFDAWIASLQQSTSSPLSAAAYDSLRAPSSYNAPQYYFPVDPSLYTSIIDSFIAPGGMKNMPNMPMNPISP